MKCCKEFRGFMIRYLMTAMDWKGKSAKEMLEYLNSLSNRALANRYIVFKGHELECKGRKKKGLDS